VAGPIAGAPIAVGCAIVLRGRGSTAISYAAGSGALDDGTLAERHRLSRAIKRGEVTPPGIPPADSPSDRDREQP